MPSRLGSSRLVSVLHPSTTTTTRSTSRPMNILLLFDSIKSCRRIHGYCNIHTVSQPVAHGNFQTYYHCRSSSSSGHHNIVTIWYPPARHLSTVNSEPTRIIGNRSLIAKDNLINFLLYYPLRRHRLMASECARGSEEEQKKKMGIFAAFVRSFVLRQRRRCLGDYVKVFCLVLPCLIIKSQWERARVLENEHNNYYSPNGKTRAFSFSPTRRLRLAETETHRHTAFLPFLAR